MKWSSLRDQRRTRSNPARSRSTARSRLLHTPSSATFDLTPIVGDERIDRREAGKSVVAMGVPPPVATVFEQREPVDRKLRLEVGQVGEDRVELLRRDVLGHGDV